MNNQHNQQNQHNHATLATHKQPPEQAPQPKQRQLSTKKSPWRYLRRFCYTVLGLLVFVGALLAYFLATESGFKQSLALAEKLTGYQIQGFSGVWLKSVQGQAFQILDKAGKPLLKGNSFAFAWQASALFDKHLNIQHLKLDTLDLFLPNTEKPAETTKKPFDIKQLQNQLAHLKLPIQITVADVALKNLQIHSNGQKPLQITQADLSATWVGDKFSLANLAFAMPDVSLQGKGDVRFVDVLPVDLTLNADYQDSKLGKQTVALNLTGDVFNQLQLNAQVAGALAAKAQIGVQDLANQLAVNAAINAQDFSPELLGGSGKATIDLTTQLTGLNLSQFDFAQLNAHTQLTADVDMPEKLQLKTHLTSTLSAGVLTLADEALKINDLPPIPITLSTKLDKQALKEVDAKIKVRDDTLHINGAVDFSPLAYQATVRGDVPSFALPLQAADKAGSAKTDKAKVLHTPALKAIALNVVGDVKQQQVNGQLQLSGQEVPTSRLLLDVHLNDKHLEKGVITLTDTADKTLLALDAKGDLQPLALHAQLKTNGLHPEWFYPSQHTIKGNITTAMQADIKWQDNAPDVALNIEQLMGELLGYPLNGQGDVLFKAPQLQVDNLLLAVAGNQLSADGVFFLKDKPATVNKPLNVNVNAPKLSALWPDLFGKLDAKLTIEGDLLNPAITADVTGSQLGYQNQQLARLALKVAIAPAQDKLQLKLEAGQIKANDLAIKQLDLTVGNRLSAHQLTLNVIPDSGQKIPELLLKTQGGLFDWQKDSRYFAGTIEQLSIKTPQAGNFALQKPSTVRVSAQDLTLKQFCLQQKNAGVCVDSVLSDLKNLTGHVDFVLKQIDRKTYGEFLPNTIKLDTVIDGHGKVVLQNGKPNGEIQIQASPSRFNVLGGSGALQGKLETFLLKATLKNNGLVANLNTVLSPVGKLNAHVQMPDIRADKLEAKLLLDNESLAFISALVPSLSNVSGKLNADFSASGSLKQGLLVKGQLALAKTQFDLAQFGSKIHDMTLNVRVADGQRLLIEGGAKAGTGDFKIDGNIDVNKRRGSLTVKGKNFQLANSDKLQVTLDPDINVQFLEEIVVRGSITVPKALIMPSSSGGNKVNASEDVVLPTKQQAKKAPENQLIDAEVSVILGDDVRVASADIETRLNGAIKILYKPKQTLRADGAIEVQTGAMRIYGQQLTIERGRVIFGNGPIANPSLDIRATRTIEDEDITVGANVLGTVSTPKISLFSTPSMSESSVLSYLLFGRAPSADTFGTAALLQTGGLVGANTLARDMKKAVGLDVLDFSIGGVEAGKNLSKKMYVGVKNNFFDHINKFLFNYKINKKYQVEGAATNQEMSVDLIRTTETD